MISSVDIHNTRKEEIEKSNDNGLGENRNVSQGQYYCSLKQLLIIVVPITVVLLFAAIFIPVYVMEKKNDDDDNEKPVVNNIYYYENPGYYEFDENIVNDTYAILTPKNGYDNILIFLGGITDNSNKYWDFFESKNTFVPVRTKIYFLSGKKREMQFMIDYGYPSTMQFNGWFNVDKEGNLKPPDDFTQATESLNLVLDEIDIIKNDEDVDYKNIYLAGFSQGAIMTNYILLNSRHELGGYIAFSGYVFDHDFPANDLVNTLTEAQKKKLADRKDYHILATHSFEDDTVPYELSTPSYLAYYHDYTDFKLLSFGNLGHDLRNQPIHPYVRKWLIESMEKN